MSGQRETKIYLCIIYMLRAPRFRNNDSRKCCKNIVSRNPVTLNVSSSSDRMAALRARVLACPVSNDNNNNNINNFG